MNSFREIDAKREQQEWFKQQEAAELHASREYDVSRLNRMGQYGVRKAGLRVSAAGMMRGMFMRELDQALESSGLTLPEKIALKYSLFSLGVLRR